MKRNQSVASQSSARGRKSGDKVSPSDQYDDQEDIDAQGPTDTGTSESRFLVCAFESRINELKSLTTKSRITYEDDHGRTALHWAAIAGHKDIADFLLEAGSSTAVADSNGFTPMVC